MVLIAVSVLSGVLLYFGGVVLLQPEWFFSRLRDISPRVLYSVNTSRRMVALTIDDGPDPETTPLILEVLKRYNARATFFLISERIPGNEELVTRMVTEGHELGNHLTADEASIRLPIEEFERKLVEADGALRPFGEIHWLRPGSGWYNDAMLSVIEKHGYRCALGSVYPYDPHLGWSWFAARYVLWKVKPGDIIVLHDFQARGKRTAKALETILPELQRRGFHVVTISTLVNLEQ